MIPDGERIVSDYLRSDDAVTAIVGRRVVGKTPADTSSPWVRLTQLDAPQEPTSRADHNVGFYCQLDCYAGEDLGQPEANLLARTIREALVRIDATELDDAVISGSRINGDARIPDTEFEPARERRVITATVWMHELAA